MTPPERQVERWRLAKEGREASCVQTPHPLGVELRVVLGDDDLRRSEVFRNPERADETAVAWRALFEQKGWRAPARRFSRGTLERALELTIAAERRVPGHNAMGHVLGYRLKVMREAIAVALDESPSLDAGARERRLIDARQELARAERGPEGQALVRPILEALG